MTATGEDYLQGIRRPAENQIQPPCLNCETISVGTFALRLFLVVAHAAFGVDLLQFGHLFADGAQG